MPPPLAWTDLGQADYGSGQRIADGGIFPKLEDNDEVAVEHIFQLEFNDTTEASVDPTFGPMVTPSIALT